MLSWACILCGYELHAQAVSLVQAQRTRPSVASDAQSLCRSRVGVHAAADPGQPGFGVFPALHGSISHDRCTRPGSAQSGSRSLGWARLLRSGLQPPRACARGPEDTPGPAIGQAGRVAGVARCREVHSGRSRVLRVRETGAHGRYECAPGADASVRKCESGNAECGIVGAGVETCTEGRTTRVEIQSSTDGAWRACLYGAKTEMPRVPGQE